MTRIQPSEEMHIEFATNQTTKERVEHMCIITLGRAIKSISEDRQKALVNAVMSEIGGVETFRPVSPYSFEVVIAKTFPADQVLEEIKKEIGIATSPLDLPAGGGGKLIVGNFEK
jgi:hypothetical protein